MYGVARGREVLRQTMEQQTKWAAKWACLTGGCTLEQLFYQYNQRKAASFRAPSSSGDAYRDRSSLKLLRSSISSSSAVFATVSLLLLMASTLYIGGVEASPKLHQLEGPTLDRYPLAVSRLSRLRRHSDQCSEEFSMRKQGLVIRKQMPNDCESRFRTTLRSPDGKRLKVKMDHAILLGEKNFVQINDGQTTWYIDKSCAPCHDEHIQGSVVSIEYRISNGSRIQFRYTTNENKCPFLTVMHPLKFRNKTQNIRDIGAIAELECLNSRDFVLVGNRTLECVRLRNGSVSWNSPLPTCHRQTNCPKIQDRNDSGVLELPISAENYYCNWNIDGNEINPTAKYIEFSVKVQPEDLVRTARRNRGLTFYDGERRITVQNGSGLHYRTRDTKLRINFHLTKAEAEFMKDASFRVDYVVVRKTCPTIDEEAFPFGTITLTDSFFIGSQAKLECAPGYDLRGDPEAVCQRDANWTFGNTMPECISLSAEADNDIRLLEEFPASVELGTADLSGKSSTTTTEDPRTPKDVLAIKNWSIRPNKSETAGASNEQHRTNIVPPRKIDISKDSSRTEESGVDSFGDRSRKGNEVTPNDGGDQGTVQQRPTFVNPKHRESANPFATAGVNKMTTGAPMTSTLFPSEDTQNRIHTSADILDRLFDLDLHNSQDIALILVVLCVFLIALFILILVVCVLHRGCREKIPIRENPLYNGAPARRINNVSFRPSSRHKRAMQERTYT